MCAQGVVECVHRVKGTVCAEGFVSSPGCQRSVPFTIASSPSFAVCTRVCMCVCMCVFISGFRTLHEYSRCNHW